MNQYINYEADILTPVQVASIIFHEKEENSLSPFQTFILEAIEERITSDQIAQATLLTPNVIEMEILQMISQNLLVHNEDALTLSKISQKILLIAQCVKQLNSEKKCVCIDLMTGDMRPFVKEDFTENVADGSLRLSQRISGKSIDGISLEENMDFFEDYMNTFSGMGQNDVETILSAIYIELSVVGRREYIKRKITNVPCAIGGQKSDSLRHKSTVDDKSLTVKGLIYKIEYTVKSAIVQTMSDILPALRAIDQRNDDLISDKGQQILNAYKRCEEYNTKHLICFFDTVSGKFQCSVPDELEDNAEFEVHHYKKVNFELPPIHDISDNIYEGMIDNVRAYYNIDNDFDIIEISRQPVDYYVTCELQDLMERKNVID